MGGSGDESDELVEDDADLVMQPPTRPSARPAKALIDAASQPPLSLSDFLCGLAASDPSSSSLSQPPTSSPSPFPRPDRATLLYERVQDRLAIRRFASQQRRQTEGEGEEGGESESNPAADDDDEEEKEEEGEGVSDEGEEEEMGQDSDEGDGGEAAAGQGSVDVEEEEEDGAGGGAEGRSRARGHPRH